MNIIVYSKPDCVQCDWTKRQLDKMELTYTDIDVTQDKTAKRDVDNMMIDGKPVVTLPVVVVSNSRRADKWSGFKIDRIRGLKSTGDY